MKLVKCALVFFLILPLGCAAGARVGGPERGVGVGAAVEPPAVVPPPPSYPPPPDFPR